MNPPPTVNADLLRAPWVTEANLARLRQWWEAGTNVAEIALRLNTTSPAISGMAHRLQLPSRKGRPSAQWGSEAAVRRLRAEWDKGTSTSAIGVLFGVSKNAIVGKAHRLDLAARPSPIRRDGVKPVAAPPSIPRPIHTLAPLPSEIAAPVPAPARESRPPIKLALIQAPRPEIATLEAVQAPPPIVLPSGECCWPIGEPGSRAFRYCGRATYCESHHVRAHLARRRESAEPMHASGDD